MSDLLDRDLLRVSRAELAPSAAERARVRTGVLRAVAGVGAAGGLGASSTAAASGTAAGLGAAWKLGLLAVVLAGGGFGLGLLVGDGDEPAGAPRPVERLPTTVTAASPAVEPTTTSIDPAPLAEAPTVVAAVAAPPVSDARRPTAPRRTASVAPSPADDRAPSSADSLAEETRLLARAHAAIAAHDGEAALRALEEHAARHPSGVLSEERSAARVAALCAAGRSDDAAREATRFLTIHPRSVYAPSVRAGCPAAP